MSLLLKTLNKRAITAVSDGIANIVKSKYSRKSVSYRFSAGTRLLPTYYYFKKYAPSIVRDIDKNIDTEASYSEQKKVIFDALYNNHISGFMNGTFVKISYRTSYVTDRTIPEFAIELYGLFAEDIYRHYTKWVTDRENEDRYRDKSKIQLYRYITNTNKTVNKSDGCINKIKLNDLVLESSVIKDIRSFINGYKHSSSTFGLLLKGPSGTGKTSLIKYIASVLDLSIYFYADKGTIPTLYEDLSRQKEAIYVFEDIDKMLEGSNLDIISQLMQAFDGLISPTKSIFILTANDADTKLNKDMIRKGRIRKDIFIEEFNNELAYKLCKRKGLSDIEINELYTTYNITFPVKPSSLSIDIESYKFDKIAKS